MVAALLAANFAGTWWQYLLLFVAVAASWAGVPFIGAAAVGAAAVAASQGHLNLIAVIAVAAVAGEVGGLIGYAIGDRWGREMLERPGKRQAGRQKMVDRGEQAYAKWGRLAVFFTPAIISGTAKMRYGQFVVWNFVASLGFALSVAPSAYGVGRVATGHTSHHDIAILVFGLAVGAFITALGVRHHRRFKARNRPANSDDPA